MPLRVHERLSADKVPHIKALLRGSETTSRSRLVSARANKGTHTFTQFVLSNARMLIVNRMHVGTEMDCFKTFSRHMQDSNN